HSVVLALRCHGRLSLQQELECAVERLQPVRQDVLRQGLPGPLRQYRAGTLGHPEREHALLIRTESGPRVGEGRATPRARWPAGKRKPPGKVAFFLWLTAAGISFRTSSARHPGPTRSGQNASAAVPAAWRDRPLESRRRPASSGRWRRRPWR